MKRLTGKPRGRIGKKRAALIITALVFLAITGLGFAGLFRFLEYKSYDLRVKLLAPYSRPSDEIVVILLDQDSIDWARQERGWSWPWPRRAYAEILDYMNTGGANSVAFDVIFSEPSVYREADDASFARAERDFGRAAQTVVFSSRTGNTDSWPGGLNKPLFELRGFEDIIGEYEKLNQNDEGFGRNAEAAGTIKAQFPIEEIRNAAGIIGSVTGWPDSDHVFRRTNLFSVWDGKAVPGLSAASLLVSGHDNTITFNKQKQVIEWGDWVIPVDKNGRSILRFRGELDRYIPYRACDILRSKEAWETGTAKTPGGEYLPPEDFAGKYVFFGYYAQGLFDTVSTPISSLYPGVGAHITMLDNLLQGDFIRESPEWVNLLILFAAVGLTALLALFSTRIPLSVGGTVLIAFAVSAASVAAYQWGNLWVPVVTHLAGIITAFITVTLYNYATEGSQKRFIKSAFSQYLSPKVIEQIIADPSQLKLGGEKREMTAIFTDIRSFSTISEALGDPEKLVELLNFYLTRMSNIVLDHQGTIDKYEGDAIIAFFGAPVHLENHADLACRAAIKMKKAEQKINKEALAQGLITSGVMEAMVRKGILKSADDPNPIFTRLGVNSGDMVVGNMGTPNKMDYTIMGNAVNLAARLEGVNKQYNTGGILASEYTREKIGDEFILRPLSRVRVVGINTPLRLYELLDIRKEAPPELAAMVKSWEQGLALYERRDFLAAQNIFHTIYGRNGADLAAKKYLDRCTKYLASPPDEAAWDDGVDNLTEK